PAMLASGSQCTLALRFTPTITDSYHATLSLTTNAPTSPNLVPVSGVGTTTPTMSLRLTPAELHFDEPSDRAFPMSQTVTISNGGEVPIRLEAFNLTNADFSLASAACGPLPYLLAPAATCSISVSLAATTAGSYQSVLDVVSDEPGATRQITLSGTLRAVRPGNLSLNTPNLTTNPYSVTLSFNVTRSNGSEGAMAAHYTITAERQPGDGDLLVNHVPLSFAADQTQQTIQVTLNRLSLIAVRDLVVTLDTPSAGTLRVPLPIEEHLVFLPLVQR
ncbi:MAG: choice-of-anchor D domain-containing protein, partial [Candidatus Viridilinea halotolerans]